MIKQSIIYDKILAKLENIKNNIIKIKEYTELKESQQIDLLTKLKDFSLEINNIDSISDDMFNEFILQTDPLILKNEDINLHKNLLINKKVYDTFLPYMLYMQIILQNT